MQNIHVPVVGIVNGLAMANAINAALDSLQGNIGGVLNKSVAGGADVTLSAAEANNGIINLTGALTGNINVLVPASAMQWLVLNNTTGAYTLTFKATGGAGMLVPQGISAILFCDGTNVLQVGASASGDYLASCRAATTANIASLAGGAPNTLDGVTLAANDRILVKDQTTGSQNGLYYVSTLGTGANGTWTRTTDADQAGELTSGSIVAVEEGALYTDSQWMLTTDGTITIGATALTFTRKDSSTPATGFRNKIINGGMAVDQRNVGAAQTFTAAAALAYCVDRWYGYCTGANVNGQRVAGSGANPYRYQFSGAAGVTGIGFGQRIEKLNCIDLAGSTATLAVDLANSLLTTVNWTAYYANTDDTFGTLASPTRTQIATGSFTVNSTVTRYSTQIAIPGAATTGIEVVFSVGAQVSGTWTIGNVQLEAGASASSFERRPITHEMAACLRRCRKSYAQNVVPGTAFSPQVSGGNVMFMSGAAGGGLFAAAQDFDVEMAYEPTVTFWDHQGNVGKMSYFLNGTTWTGNVAPSTAWGTVRRVFAAYQTGTANNNGAAFGYLATAEL